MPPVQNEPRGTLPDLDSSTWGGGDGSRGRRKASSARLGSRGGRSPKEGLVEWPWTLKCAMSCSISMPGFSSQVPILHLCHQSKPHCPQQAQDGHLETPQPFSEQSPLHPSPSWMHNLVLLSASHSCSPCALHRIIAQNDQISSCAHSEPSVPWKA